MMSATRTNSAVIHDSEKDEDETYEVTKEQYKQVETGAGYTIVVDVDEITEITPAE